MRYKLFIILLIFANFGASASAPAQPPWLQPDVVQAALRIGLSEEQRPLFRIALTEMFEQRAKNIRKVLRQHNVTGLERKLKRVTKRALRRLDEDVSEFLKPGQQSAYETYRDRLQDHMSNSKLAVTAPGAAGQAEGIGTHNPDWH